jgi:Zinc finger C-x8-C-x5-C-x3-H type (and similar)
MASRQRIISNYLDIPPGERRQTPAPDVSPWSSEPESAATDHPRDESQSQHRANASGWGMSGDEWKKTLKDCPVERHRPLIHWSERDCLITHCRNRDYPHLADELRFRAPMAPRRDCERYLSQVDTLTGPVRPPPGFGHRPFTKSATCHPIESLLIRIALNSIHLSMLWHFTVVMALFLLLHLPTLSNPVIADIRNHFSDLVAAKRREQDEHTPPTSPLKSGKDPNQTKPVLFKTELCRNFEEKGTCRYGYFLLLFSNTSVKCQFAHTKKEQRELVRHPKYKTQLCKTFLEVLFS